MAMQRKLSANAGVLFFVLIFCAGLCFAADDVKDLEGLIIGSIETEGNLTITRGQVLSTVRARVGEKFDSKSAEEDTKRLMEIGGIEFAYFNGSNVDGKVKLIYVVVEQNLVRSIVFKGNEKGKTSQLSKELDFKRGDYLDVIDVKRGSDAIREYYLKKGYANVKVAIDSSKIDVGQVIYNIEEGPRIRVKSIDFTDSDTIKERKLLKTIKTKRRKFFFWPAYFNEENFGQDAARLEAVYRDNGYLDVKVTNKVSFNESGDRAYVEFVIDQGPLYIVESITITGNTFFDESVIRDILKLKEGIYYSEERGQLDRKHILSLYREKGFINVGVEEKRNYISPGRINSQFDITAGSRFRIGKIDVKGNELVHDKVIRHILDEDGFTPGDWYNGDIARGDGKGELEIAVRRLTNSGSAVILPSGDKPDQRDASVNIIEAESGKIMFGAGVASNTGLMGNIVFEQRNFDISDWPESFADFASNNAFKGAGQTFRASWYPGVEQSSFSIGFTEPYLYDKPVSLNTTISGFERMQESYDEERVKGYIGFEKRYEDDWRRGIAFRAENVDIGGFDIDAPQEIRDVAGSNRLFSAEVAIRKNTTDSRFTPSKGYNFESKYEQIGGDFTFGVLSGTQRWYKTIHEDLAERKTILETKLLAAAIVGDAPPFEKFYAGGSGSTYSVRGFRYRGISPRGLQTNVVNPQRDDPIGSDWIFIASSELAVPLTSEVFSWLFFVDAAMIDTGGPRASIGTGIQILLPQWFGPVPMRFEIAKPFMSDDDDDTRMFSFSVGALF